MSHESQTGFFISFEGSEGCGKSTQIDLLVKVLSAAAIPAVVVREPGSTPIGENIRHLIKHSAEGRDMAPETELLLFAASRAQLVRERILPALEANQIVISDRFLDSTTVYQGIARKIPSNIVDKINQFAAGPRLPDITFLLDMDPQEAQQRVLRRSGLGPDRMEEQPFEFYQAVRQGYLRLAAVQKERIRLLDATKPAAEIAGNIQAILRLHGTFKGISL
ncbi:MAG TPA: dTMP kinase [Terrimicrobiaceae bacterium]